MYYISNFKSKYFTKGKIYKVNQLGNNTLQIKTDDGIHIFSKVLITNSKYLIKYKYCTSLIPIIYYKLNLLFNNQNKII